MLQAVLVLATLFSMAEPAPANRAVFEALATKKVEVWTADGPTAQVRGTVLSASQDSAVIQASDGSVVAVPYETVRKVRAMLEAIAPVAAPSEAVEKALAHAKELDLDAANKTNAANLYAGLGGVIAY